MTTTAATVVLGMDYGTDTEIPIFSAVGYTELNFLSCACQLFFPIHAVIDIKLKCLIQW